MKESLPVYGPRVEELSQYRYVVSKDPNNISYLLPALLQEHGENITFAQLIPENQSPWIKGERVALYADDKARKVEHEIAATPEVQAMHAATAGILHHEESFLKALQQTSWNDEVKQMLEAVYHQQVADNQRILLKQIDDPEERATAEAILQEHQEKSAPIHPDFVGTLLSKKIDDYYQGRK